MLWIIGESVNTQRSAGGGEQEALLIEPPVGQRDLEASCPKPSGNLWKWLHHCYPSPSIKSSGKPSLSFRCHHDPSGISQHSLSTYKAQL